MKTEKKNSTSHFRSIASKLERRNWIVQLLPPVLQSVRLSPVIFQPFRLGWIVQRLHHLDHIFKSGDWSTGNVGGGRTWLGAGSPGKSPGNSGWVTRLEAVYGWVYKLINEGVCFNHVFTMVQPPSKGVCVLIMLIPTNVRFLTTCVLNLLILLQIPSKRDLHYNHYIIFFHVCSEM